MVPSFTTYSVKDTVQTWYNYFASTLTKAGMSHGDSDTDIDDQSSDTTSNNITTLININREEIEDERDFDTDISSEKCLTTITKNKHGNVNPDWILLDS